MHMDNEGEWRKTETQIHFRSWIHKVAALGRSILHFLNLFYILLSKKVYT